MNSTVDDGMMKYVRQWHGTIDHKFDNLNNLTDVIRDHALWTIPASLEKELKEYRGERQIPVTKRNACVSLAERGAKREPLSDAAGGATREG